MRLEIDTAATRGVRVRDGRDWQGLRVRYRAEGTRPWRKFLLIADEGESPLDLEAKVVAAVVAHQRRQAA